jgi:4-hydroxybenzoate polyprenyltransferase
MNKQTLIAYFELTRLNRPVGIYLVLWPALWSLWLASGGIPELNILVIFILGTILMRSAGCVINDYADRNLDGHVARTCERPLVTGELTVKQALSFFFILCGLAFLLVLQLNLLTILLSLGAVALAALYPFMKRYTYWPQVFLGAAFAWAIPMGFSAVQNTVPEKAWLVFAIAMLWALIYDTAYALKDKDDDEKIGIKSTAILFGRYVRGIIGVFQLLMLVGLIWMGKVFQLDHQYLLSLFGVVGLLVYHQWLLSKNTPEAAFKAFLNNHWIGLVVLIGVMSGLS